MNVVSLLLLIIYLFDIALASYVELKVSLKQLNTGINDVSPRIACNLLLKLIFFLSGTSRQTGVIGFIPT